MNDGNSDRTRNEEDVQEDLELRDEDANEVVGGATAAGASLDPPPDHKYDLKSQKGG